MPALVPRGKFALLIVEGDGTARRQLEEAAKQSRCFWSVRTMTDGRFALEYLWSCVESGASDAPDIVIANTHLAGLDGLQLTRELRRSPELREIYVALLAANGGTLERDAADNAGCDFFLRRPRVREELIETLEAIATRCGSKAPAPEQTLS